MNRYDQLLSEINDELEKRVLEELLPGKPVTRREFIWAIFGEVVAKDANLADDPRDRKIRKCIEQLREKDYAIVSSSNKAGYRLVTDEDEVEKYIAEQRRRMKSVERKIAHGYRALGKLPAVREYQSVKVEQLKLL